MVDIIIIHFCAIRHSYLLILIKLINCWPSLSIFFTKYHIFEMNLKLPNSTIRPI